MYNYEHTPVKDLLLHDKQSRHLVRTERSDTPEDLRKAITSFGEQSAMNGSTRPATVRASH